jgi:hypothetical protein
MNTNSIAINTAALKSIRMGCADKDVRYLLKGVMFSCDGETLRLTASNGQILLTHTKALSDPCESFKIIIPSESIDIALKVAGKAVELCLDILDGGRYSLAGIPVAPLQGAFPDASKVWPKWDEMDGKPCTINPDYYSIVGKISKIMGVGVYGAKLWHDSGKLVFESGEVRGLIMGLEKDKNGASSLPSF